MSLETSFEPQNINTNVEYRGADRADFTSAVLYSLFDILDSKYPCLVYWDDPIPESGVEAMSWNQQHLVREAEKPGKPRSSPALWNYMNWIN
jgi:hypothetical protein